MGRGEVAIEVKGSSRIDSSDLRPLKAFRGRAADRRSARSGWRSSYGQASLNTPLVEPSAATFSVISCPPAAFFQRLFTRRGQPVFLQAATGFVRQRVCDQPFSHHLADRPFQCDCLAAHSKGFRQCTGGKGALRQRTQKPNRLGPRLDPRPAVVSSATNRALNVTITKSCRSSNLGGGAPGRGSALGVGACCHNLSRRSGKNKSCRSLAMLRSSAHSRNPPASNVFMG